MAEDFRARAKLSPKGRLYEDFTVGEVRTHHWGRTIFESDTVLFTTLTLSFNRGSVTSMITNPTIGSHKGTSTYAVAGNVLTLNQDNGETFVLRWKVNGDELTLKRDEALGVGPTPLLVKPFIRQQ